MSKKEIIFLGTGAPDAVNYFHSSIYIKEGNLGMLVDTGGGAQILTQLNKASIALSDIKHIFITHKHIDHIWGLFWILRFLGSSIAKNPEKKLIIFCAHDVEKFIKKISAEVLKEKIIKLFDRQIIFHHIKNNTRLSIGTWNIDCIDTQSQKIEQFGFSLNFDNGIKFVCLGDEPYKNALHANCENSDYFMHEAFCLEQDRENFKPEKIHHSTVMEACINAKMVDAKNLIIFHTEDKTLGKRKKLYKSEGKKYFNGNIIIPDDLESIELKK